jgi:Putative zinc-finger
MRASNARKIHADYKRGTAMGHDEAVRTLATEKYLLGELDPELCDQFEAHVFACQHCAFDLWAAATFLKYAKVVLSRQV